MFAFMMGFSIPKSCYIFKNRPSKFVSPGVSYARDRRIASRTLFWNLGPAGPRPVTIRAFHVKRNGSESDRGSGDVDRFNLLDLHLGGVTAIHQRLGKGNRLVAVVDGGKRALAFEHGETGEGGSDDEFVVFHRW